MGTYNIHTSNWPLNPHRPYRHLLTIDILFFSTDTDSSYHDADKELESILQSDTYTPNKLEIFDQALNNATSTLKKSLRLHR